VASRFPTFQRWHQEFELFLFLHMLPTSADVMIGHYREFTAKAANLTGVSIVFICITAALVTATIERELNAIWGVARRRPLAHRLLVYALGLTAGPIIAGAGISLTTWLVAQSLAIVPVRGLTAEVLLKPLSFLFSMIALTLLYAFVPSRHVAWRHAAIGGLTAAFAFEAAKYGFAYYLSKVPTYELVYGALAALPVFLLWLYLCWLIVLSGAVIAATLAHVEGTD